MHDDLRPLWRQFRATRDPDVRDALIRQTVGLVRRVAGRLALRLPPHVEVDDLESAGIPGLLAAIENYDPDKDVEFATYAQVRIRGAILDDLRSMDTLPRSVRDRARHIDRARAALEQRLLRSPEDHEIAAHLQMDLETYHQVLYELRGGLQVSLDATGSARSDDGEDAPGPHAVAERGAADPWQAMALKARQVFLGEIIDALPGAERTVLSLYYYEELTMKEIAEVLGVSESRVSQIHGAALRRLRGRLRRSRLEAEDLAVTVGTPPARGGMTHAVP
jgi:RNA polymerase sigma factor for flagellar operon FliA